MGRRIGGMGGDCGHGVEWRGLHDEVNIVLEDGEALGVLL